MRFNVYATLGKEVYTPDTIRRLTLEESIPICRAEWGGYFQDKETLLQWFLNTESNNHGALLFLCRELLKHRYRGVLSLGAGSCVTEYLLKQWLPDDTEIVAVDHNPYYIDKARQLFPSLKVQQFDFFNDDVADLGKLFNKGCEVAVFFGSAYSMDDETFVKLFAGLRALGVHAVIDFHAGFIRYRRIPLELLTELKWTLVDRLRLKSLMRGVFVHGYARTRSELRKLYKQAGFTSIQETSVPPQFRYVSVLSDLNRQPLALPEE